MGRISKDITNLKRCSPEKAFERMEKSFDVIHKSRKIINHHLEQKFGWNQVHIDHNEADGIILVHSDESNIPVTISLLKALLCDEVTVEETLKYLIDNSI